MRKGVCVYMVINFNTKFLIFHPSRNDDTFENLFNSVHAGK